MKQKAWAIYYGSKFSWADAKKTNAINYCKLENKIAKEKVCKVVPIKITLWKK